ncbi:hypothetical protein TELCIR_14697 [Teladorsagia circumcincta]|uniref:Rapamycin-insensitive companion of mTOR N-terminal domain-containing protein n=1 Tax=Teladorsagia circumcincta TaxID=45464 RepID=A0A2G9U0G1_TELCI|nr:hypothetical protein TELCIR_14697 [Teladorsagia circumcincta]
MMMVYQQSHLKRLIEFSAAQHDGKKYAFPKSVMQPVIALALRAICSRKGKESYDKPSIGENIPDRLSIACFEIFLEFCVLEPDLILSMAGTDWMQIFAPLIEFGFFQKNMCLTEQLLEYLGLGTVDDCNLARIRDMIVDICCDFLDLPYAGMRFENWNHALQYYSSISTPDEFSSSLKDDFVLAQSEMCIAMDEVNFDYFFELVRHVDLLRSFRSLAGFILLNAGLLQSLARLIVAQPDSSSGLKATLFVTDVVRTASSVMPCGWRATLLSMPTLVQSACETLAQSKAAAAIHGYYDPNQTERFTFPHSGNAAMLLHRFDMLNKAWIANSLSGPATDSHYSLFLSSPKSLSLPGRCFSDDSSIQSLIDDTLGGDNGGINWEAAPILLARVSDGNKEVGKSSMDALYGVLDKVKCKV